MTRGYHQQWLRVAVRLKQACAFCLSELVMRSADARVFLILSCVLLGTVVAITVTPGLDWRTRVLRHKFMGRLQDIEWAELIFMLTPGHRPYLRDLAATPDVHVVVKNPYGSTADVVAGSKLFGDRCSNCHKAEGIDGSARRSLQRELMYGNTDWAVYKNIQHGIPGTGMPGFRLPSADAWRLVAYTHSLTTPPRTAGVTNSGTFQTVEYEDILKSVNHPASWLTYSGSYTGQRYSPLASINRNNVSELRVTWLYQMDASDRINETTPLVVGDVMYLSGPPADVVALNARNGEHIWTYSHGLPSNLPLGYERVNRGVAISGNLVLYATADAHLVALNMRTGEVVWQVELADASGGYSGTAAPLVIKDKVVVGIAGGEFGIRGFLDAYEARTGRRAWRFYTIPGPGEPGHDTWERDSWKTGGGPTWMTGSFDPDLNLIYWGTGNPAPSFVGQKRHGENLYTSSLIAVDADTGKLRWHFQFTPHDVHDWDANQVPVLVDLATGNGRIRKLVLSANKNGFLYVLDRQNGELVRAVPIARQNWARLDEAGQPVPVSTPSDNRPVGVLYPGTNGAANWWPPAFSPVTKLLYVPVLEEGTVLVPTEATYRAGQLFTGGDERSIPGGRSWSALRAIDLTTGKLVWEVSDMNPASRPLSGTLVTAGGLVFWGTGNSFLALDAVSGQRLWSFNVGAQVHAAPITFSIEGKQRVAVAAGRSILCFELPELKRGS